jgi:hypothetical protein
LLVAGKLDEVAWRAGVAGYFTVEDAVAWPSVEHRRDFAEREKRGLAGAGFWKFSTL